MDDAWIPLAETARKAGVNERTMRRRMVALHQRMGGGVLRSYHPEGGHVRKWFVNAAALRAGIEKDPDATEVALGEHLVRIEELEKKLLALRQSHIAVKRQVKAVQLALFPAAAIG